MVRVEIDKDKPLRPGDVIEMHFKTYGGTWLQAGHIAFIEWNLEGRKEFTIISSQIPDPHSLIFEVRINKTNPVLVTASVIGALIIAAGLVAWLTLDKVYQIIESPAGQVGIAGLGLVGIAAAIAIVIILFKK